jgi:mono/diheme cytochrome c family protein
MNSRPGSVGIMLVVRVVVALALVEYCSAPAATPAAQTRAVAPAAKKRAQKLARALRACKQDKSKSKRRACEEKARKLYGARKHSGRNVPSGANAPSRTGTGSTGAGAKTTATTGTGTTEGAGGATEGAGASTGTGMGTGTTTGATTRGNVTEELEKARHAPQMPTPGAIEHGRALFAQDCAGCHGTKGEGQSGDDFVAYANLPRAQSVTGVIEQLIEPDGGMPTFDALPFEQKEEIGDYVCVVLTAKCEEAH